MTATDSASQPLDDAARAGASLSAVRLSTFALRREPPRPIEDRLPGYEELFDFDTLFYDVFRTADPRQVMCLGPPLLNCGQALSRLIVRLPGTNEAIAWRYLPPHSHFQPTCRFLLTGAAIAEAERVILEIAGIRAEISIQPSDCPRFAGRRVIVALSKDNPLPWIRDWAEFNRRVHGADAILFYDNGSTAYNPAELHRALENLPGMAEVLVVPWRFPYGPGVGPRNIQDSFYCQPGALEHARRRCCAMARGVLNTDIDELVVVPSAGSIFDRAEMCDRAVIVFPGLWAVRPDQAPVAAGLVRHTDCVYSERWRRIFQRLIPFRWFLRTKWVLLPGLCPEDVDWGVHDIHPAGRQARQRKKSWRYTTRRVLYRHFRPISTGWKPSRWEKARYSSIAFGFDLELARAFAVAFPGRPIAQARSILSRCFSWLSGRWLSPPGGR
jgi:hypothetical protein